MYIYRYAAALLFLVLPVTSQGDSTTRVGDTLQIAIPALALGATFYMGDEAGRTQLYKSFATNLLITHSVKRISNKRRPDNSDNKSFPSGHTSAAFQGASFIHFRYGFRYSVPAYLAAGFVGYSRVDAKKHDYADVLAGAALGIASSWLFTQPMMKPLLEPVKGVNLIPVVREDGFGMMLSTRW